ncbi:unnamed protein product [Schistosoma mattheei]|uniref:Uncharacterized protein n=1 Tax=Schistosoma mattheei TaxID=31246 RepID=A0A183NMN9_9TREM|nr:unnamed protein product [Schistosoma mattheei]
MCGTYHHSNSFRGFAFVEFRTSKSARKAVKHMCAFMENEKWLVQPTEANEVSECPESAWKPRLASKVSFSPQQMLARRHIWRCCSRKNKQLIAAFKHLRQVGYTASNPCDKECKLKYILKYLIIILIFIKFIGCLTLPLTKWQLLLTYACYPSWRSISCPLALPIQLCSGQSFPVAIHPFDICFKFPKQCVLQPSSFPFPFRIPSYRLPCGAV